VRPRRLTQIDNGIDPEAFSPQRPDDALRSSLGIASDDVVVGTVGRLAPLKGLEVLVEAAAGVVAQVPRAKLMFIGDGPLRQRLEHLASERGLQRRVVFTGARDDVPRLLSLLEVFVLPSLAEGQPMALLEAMSAAKAVVATRVGDVPKMVEGGECGIVIPPGDPAALTDAVVSLLRDEGRRSELARKARQTVLAKFTLQVMAERYQSLYRSLIPASGPASAALGMSP
jgi:glycosyltransferase involved in cell wall biosynthesis